MDNTLDAQQPPEQSTSRRRKSRSYRERLPESDTSDNEPVTADASTSLPQPSARRISRTPSDASTAPASVPLRVVHPYYVNHGVQLPASNSVPTLDTPHHGRTRRRSLAARAHWHAGPDSAVGSPSQVSPRPRGGYRPYRNPSYQFSFEDDLSLALEDELLGRRLPEDEALDDDEQAQTYVESCQPVYPPSPGTSAAGARRSDPIPRRPRPGFDYTPEDWEEYGIQFDLARVGVAHSSDDTSLPLNRVMTGPMKRSRDKFESADSKDIPETLIGRGAVAAMLYHGTTPYPDANDIWPNFRSSAKLPAQYFLLDKNYPAPTESKSKRRPSKNLKKKMQLSMHADEKDDDLPDAHAGRPKWELPVELMELIAEYLNRDDIKSLRLVSKELNQSISQVIFKTVVVPFNTEIYGMLGSEQKLDLKGKKRARLDKPGYSWKNANGDEVYDGHGLDVFCGFGRHILKYGMSFEVNEDSLSRPPNKTLTEKKASFWGSYDWPYEDYRRFDAVAGLESAADETPRMKTAFKELSKVKELALSIDSGLGWLNGPDRSIRARILQRPPEVFGTSKDVPDRQAQAQRELWNHLEACHQGADKDIRLATLYKMDGSWPLCELKDASVLAMQQPDMPFLDPHLIHEATPHDTTEIQIPVSFDDPEALDRFVLTPSSSSTGILFSSIVPPTDAGQLLSPIIPASLTKAQKEWLLETEWAQRAFLSSYMLSIIDNPTSFNQIHTLNISRLSDRYILMLNRPDFWDTLPSLSNVTLMVIPGWRTVHKDEAGFVDTPGVNPCSGIDSFCELLKTHVACRPNITKLTIGWVSGGEHAEGLHARNKLLLPAPLIEVDSHADQTSISASDMATEQDPNKLRTSLLHFPHVTQLTLKNCWITPSSLLQFVKIHDVHSLKHLVLNSVSLTAMLRANGNANHAGQAGAALNVPMAGLWNVFNNNGGVQALAQVQAHVQPQNLPNHQQFLQVYIQSLIIQLQQLQANAGGIQQQQQITALQNQLQQQVVQIQNQIQLQILQQVQPQAQPQLQPLGQNQGPQNQVAQPFVNVNQVAALATQVSNMQQQVLAAGQPLPILANNIQAPPAQAAPAQAPAQAPAASQTLLRTQPREGSWLNVIDIISPGTNLSDFNSSHSQADSERSTALESIEFISCGYAKLPYAVFDQSAIEFPTALGAVTRNPFFVKRHSALIPAMLTAKWTHLGDIVQEVDLTELATLNAAWSLRTGWDDAEEARAVEFDGLMPGGTGRFTGKVRREDRVAQDDSAS
ncbi:hypothetical protein P153DRAFT_326337 [Dothidotthia symphoricarpi CBS 119687]|uniref:F-box domain-containing protein n=1 Tax=Dothidotthia symphoricarpi CBS 119687 TaxID=1392245 RepID=A0A6A6A284_9PLEO|nr:uncharacterized protein P153DRAFT_326337 [Dothidotthia symphoricarpi CBS 119687]KAF2124848.1 hypothetical protein P153DRAFT_326337 [Dothidotthia symphoricarpi CBS 119687]